MKDTSVQTASKLYDELEGIDKEVMAALINLVYVLTVRAKAKA